MLAHSSKSIKILQVPSHLQDEVVLLCEKGIVIDAKNEF